MNERPQLFLPDFSFKKFDQIELIGKGAFSSVVKARLKQDNQVYAIKICDLGAKADPLKCIENLNREIGVHKGLDHKNIVKLRGFFIESKSINIVLDYVPNGNLFGYIRYMRETPLVKFLTIFLDICLTIEYLHKRSILHRDIKPENILLDEDFNPVFCDFGYSVQMELNEHRETFCGTLEYIAPEIFKGDSYSMPADVWSLGVLLYEMMHGYSPFKGKNYKEVSDKVLSGNWSIDDSLSLRLSSLIRSILVLDPAERPTLLHIVKETREIIGDNDIFKIKKKSRINLSINLDGSSTLNILNVESTKASNPNKSSSPSFIKNFILQRQQDSKLSKGLTNSSSENKLLDSTTRRKKARVILNGNHIDSSLTNSELVINNKLTLNRKESKGDSDGKKKKKREDSGTIIHIKSQPRLNTDTHRRASNSRDTKKRDKKSPTKLPKSISNFYTKMTMSSPRVDEKSGKFNGKLSESHKHLCITPKERPDKDLFFASMVFAPEKTSAIFTQISKQMSKSKPKSSVEQKRVKVQHTLLGSGKELFKPKAKSFRSSQPIHLTTNTERKPK